MDMEPGRWTAVRDQAGSPTLKKVEERQRGCPEPSATAEIAIGSEEGGLTLRPSVQDSVVLTG